MRRPDVFTLDYSHPLAQGLIFGMLGNRPGSSIAEDSSINAQRCAIAGDLRWTQFFGRNCLQSFSAGAMLSAVLPTIPAATPVTLCWQEYALSTGLGTGYGRVTDGTMGALLSDGNLARFSFEASFGFFRANVNLSSSLQLRPTHMCAVYQPSSFTFYEDQVQRDSATGTKIERSGAFYLFNNSGGTRTFHGIISDFCIYNRALAVAEIALLADRTDPMLGGLIVEERPVLYFDMGGGTEVEGPAFITAASTIAASGSKQATSPATVTASASVGMGGVKGAVAPLNIVGTLTVEASGIKSTSSPATVTAAVEYGASGIKTIIGLDKEGPAVIAASITVGMGGVKGGVGAAVLGADYAPTAGWTKGAAGQAWVAAMGEFYASRGPDEVPITADEIGRAVSLQARNYTAVLAKRNYTARL